MARIVFVIARNIANTKNPLPTRSEDYEYFEYLVQLDVRGSNKYGSPISAKERIDRMLSRDMLNFKRDEVRN